MKLATYNLQNIFYRHTDLIRDYHVNHLSYWQEEFESLQIKKLKGQKELDRLRELAILMGFHNEGSLENMLLEQIEGQIYYSQSEGNLDRNQNINKNWYGWAKSKSLPISVTAIANKSKVILDANADILVVQEVENRKALMHFNKVYLKQAYNDVFFIEGNSLKDQGMGILLKKGYDLKTFNSFANEKDNEGQFLFKNDVQLYCINRADKKSLFILNISLNARTNIKIRKQQFQRITDLVKMCTATHTDMVVVGTLGLPSYNESITKLIKECSLRQINSHPNFEATLDKGADASYYRLGAYTKGINMKQKDYLLVSQSLFSKLKDCGLNRKGVWSRKKPKWETYTSLYNEMAMASEHPLLWSKFDF